MRELTRAEMVIMRIVWDHKGMFLADIVAAFPEPRPAYTTISTVVRTLVSKGFLTYQQMSKVNLYSAAVAREDYSQHAMERMQRDLFGGSHSAMLSFFAKTPAERRELLAMLSEESGKEE
ncbi:MAG: BlaI/MecI/CopY family transcriptional regulator [Rikenellaceae bacterium]